jgi:hypothetical protein
MYQKAYPVYMIWSMHILEEALAEGQKGPDRCLIAVFLRRKRGVNLALVLISLKVK